MYERLTAYITLMVKDWKVFPGNQKEQKECLFLSLLFNTVLKVLPSEISVEKEIHYQRRD